MATIADAVLDAALTYIVTNAERLVMCSSEPADYAGVASVTLGVKSAPTFTGPADRSGGGRQITIDAVTDGTSSAAGDPTHWALVDDTSSVLLVTGAETSANTLNESGEWSCGAIEIGIPDPS